MPPGLFLGKALLDQPHRHYAAVMIGLTDIQLKIVMQAARSVPVEKRDTFLQRIAAMLALRGHGRFTDTDVADVAQLALARLIQTTDSAA
jgi:hypothetical protein